MPKKIPEAELQINGTQVLQKVHSEHSDHFNWECIASFHHLRGSVKPEDMAKAFFVAITD